MKKYRWIATVLLLIMTSCCGSGKNTPTTYENRDMCCEASCCAQNLCSDYTANNYATEDKNAITTAIEYYIEGGRQADSRITRKAFAEGATMSWPEDGMIRCVPIQTLYDMVDREKPCEVSYEMILCNVQHDIAVVRIESKFGEACYSDMFTLVKSSNGWKITSKIYCRK